jgi:exodeoxyribonuclease V gamma subunit
MTGHDKPESPVTTNRNDRSRSTGIPTGATAETNPAQEQACVSRSLARLRNAGELPLRGLGDLKQQVLQTVLTTMLQAWHAEQARFPQAAERQSVRLQEGEVVLEDWIDHLRRGSSESDPASADQTSVVTAWLELEPGNLIGKAKEPIARADKLLGPWVRALAIAATGMIAQGVLVGRDGVVEISPMPQEVALKTLGMLLTLWLQGMNSALPLPPKTALAWLADKGATSQYEGGHMQSGDVKESCLARMFPDFEALTADGRFEGLAQQVYAPMLEWANLYVTARRHTSEQAAEVSA